MIASRLNPPTFPGVSEFARGMKRWQTKSYTENQVGNLTVSGFDDSVVSEGVYSLGQRTGVRTTFQGSAGVPPASRDIVWQYDSLGQVISADDDSPAADRAHEKVTDEISYSLC